MILSLFCGAGGLDLGFESEGFEIGLAFDIRPTAIETYNFNRQSNHAFVRDISKLTVEQIDQLYGSEFKPKGIIGGPPCQSFSVSNVNSKDDDPRHDLPLAYANLLMQLNQRNPLHFFVFENVLGLKSYKHKAKYETFKKAFVNAGFNLQEIILNASDFEVPQERKRIFIIGLNRKLYPAFSFIFHKSKIVKSVKSAIYNLPEPVNFNDFRNGNEITYHPNHWCMTPKSAKFQTPGALIPGKALGRSFRVLEWHKPSPTVAYGHREVHIHPNCHRRLSVHEAAILQGFPFEFEFQGTMSSQFTQISEAVPPQISRALAKGLNYLIENLNPQT